MILRILMAALVLLPIAAPVEGGVWDNVCTFFKRPRGKQSPSIQVLIAVDKQKVNITIDGPFKGYDPRTGENILFNKIGKKAVMEVMDGGIKWSEEFPGVHQILLAPSSPATRIFVDGVEYTGLIYIYDVANSLSVVNKVDMESYLTSIMSPLDDENHPRELLSALAITTRTNAYFLAENPKNAYWSVDGSVVGYHGAINASQAPDVVRAINETRYMILSRTGAYEGIVTPFLSYWSQSSSSIDSSKLSGVYSKITLADAEKMAKHGSNAAQILNRAYPETTIQMIYSTPGARH